MVSYNKTEQLIKRLGSFADVYGTATALLGNAAYTTGDQYGRSIRPTALQINTAYTTADQYGLQPCRSIRRTALQINRPYSTADQCGLQPRRLIRPSALQGNTVYGTAGQLGLQHCWASRLQHCRGNTSGAGANVKKHFFVCVCTACIMSRLITVITNYLFFKLFFSFFMIQLLGFPPPQGKK